MGSRANCLDINPSFGILCNLMSLSGPQLSHLSNGNNKGNSFTELLELNGLIHLVPSTSKLLLKSRPSFLPDSLPSQYPFLLPTFPPSPSFSGLSFLLAASSIFCAQSGPPWAGEWVTEGLASLVPVSPPHGASAETWLLQTVGGYPCDCDSSPSQEEHGSPQPPAPFPYPFPYSCLKWRKRQGCPGRS